MYERYCPLSEPYCHELPLFSDQATCSRGSRESKAPAAFAFNSLRACGPAYEVSASGILNEKKLLAGFACALLMIIPYIFPASRLAGVFTQTSTEVVPPPISAA